MGNKRVPQTDPEHFIDISVPLTSGMLNWPGERLLLKTRNSNQRWWEYPFDEHFVYISADAARYLAAQRVMTVGVDYLSVGGFHHGETASHQALLRK